MDWPGLREQLVLQAWLDLIQLHESVLGKNRPWRFLAFLGPELGVRMTVIALLQGAFAPAPSAAVGELLGHARPLLGEDVVQVAIFLDVGAAGTCDAQKE